MKERAEDEAYSYIIMAVYCQPLKEKVEAMRLAEAYAAMELYRMHKLSMGKASELAEMNKTDFLFELGKYEIPAINYDPDDFREEAEWIMRK